MKDIEIERANKKKTQGKLLNKKKGKHVSELETNTKTIKKLIEFYAGFQFYGIKQCHNLWYTLS